MEATRPVPLPELCAAGSGQTIRVSLDTASNLDGGYRDLVVAEVRHAEDGSWEVYARPLSRPTEGRRLQVWYGQGASAMVVASPDEESTIRGALAEYLRLRRTEPPVAGADPDEQNRVVVVDVGNEELVLGVRVGGLSWRVVL